MELKPYICSIFAFVIALNICYAVMASQPEDTPPADNNNQPSGQEVVEEAQTAQITLPKEILVEKDSSVMMLVPAGQFWMGLKEGPTHHDAQPHKLYIDAFYMDKCEVTNRQYNKFVEETGHKKPFYHNDPRFSDHMFPVIGVDWEDAAAYAKWAGKRLPTEAEWEKAARGGLHGKKYPWGDDLDKEKANYHSMLSTPVASYNPNGYGLYDMAGNVWEWVSDFYSPNYYTMSPLSNPQGPKYGVRFKVLRGGAFNTSWQSLLCGHRHSYDPTLSHYFIGFRCAKDIE